jgi:hypothetical protein
MVISKPMPAATFSLYDPTAGGWAFVGDPQRLVRGAPRLKTRLTGSDPLDAPPIQMDFATPYTPVLFGVIARSSTTSTSPGFSVQGRPTGSDEFSVSFFGGGSPLYRLPDGTLTGLYLSENTIEIDGLRFSYGPNEENFVDIGQLLAAEVFEFRATRDWQESRENLSTNNTTVTGQPFPVTRPSVRVASVTVAPVGYSDAIADGNSLQELHASLSGFRPACCVPMPRGISRGDSAAIDQEAVTRSGLFGYCDQLGSISVYQGSSKFQLSLRFREAPG